MTGIITRMLTTRGFGFVKGDDGLEYFMHAKDVDERQAWEQLAKGQHVEFTPAENGTGGNRRRAMGVLKHD